MINEAYQLTVNDFGIGTSPDPLGIADALLGAQVSDTWLADVIASEAVELQRQIINADILPVLMPRVGARIPELIM